ncbi:Tn3 family transposase [Pseudonocardia ammonioxydans]|uniref:Tn3 family transposase n=1 Tax=Pseudonocardia ammonioxydans TaxID=260086 RepID=UPI002481F49C|nr:Tn3 family transposase [Pseudonocardia ammonioxydans]
MGQGRGRESAAEQAGRHGTAPFGLPSIDRSADAGRPRPRGNQAEHLPAPLRDQCAPQRRRRPGPRRLHLLQSALVHINTLLLQRVLDDPSWAARLEIDDQRGLTPLFWSNINPYGRFSLDMDTRLDLAVPTTVPKGAVP